MAPPRSSARFRVWLPAAIVVAGAIGAAWLLWPVIQGEPPERAHRAAPGGEDGGTAGGGSEGEEADGGPRLAAATGDGGGGAAPDAAAPKRQSYEGWIRFVHLAADAGRVRFVARNHPRYDESWVELVLEPGDNSGYIRAPAVQHVVNAYFAPDDAIGGEPIREEHELPAERGLIEEHFRADVYFDSGCTVILHGSKRRPKAAADRLGLSRVVDVPSRPQDEQGALRFYPAVVATGPKLELASGEESLVRDMPFGEATGYRLLESGEVQVSARRGRRPLTDALRFELPAGAAHTAYVWGDARRRDVHVLLASDHPPGVDERAVMPDWHEGSAGASDPARPSTKGG